MELTKKKIRRWIMDAIKFSDQWEWVAEGRHPPGVRHKETGIVIHNGAGRLRNILYMNGEDMPLWPWQYMAVHGFHERFRRRHEPGEIATRLANRA